MDSGGWGRCGLAEPGLGRRGVRVASVPRDQAVSYPQRRRIVNNILQIILNLISFDAKPDSESIRETFRRHRQEKSPTTF
ncbi:hypothetical protein [Inquilinus limosus]|uniref:hypothetical protein n=1 Tax=Inquilinus limosus TaxID=171674 RepID=UPI00138AC690|nr:hypothetical protein [Inquilinus limosus]